MSTTLTSEQALEIAKQATIYGYPMVANYRTMYYSTQIPYSNDGFNVLVNQKKLCGPEDTLVVTPNNDTLYSKAWLDLRSEPMVLTVPAIEDRYYSFQIIDLFTNNIYGYQFKAGQYTG